ncbi:hypothetical protein [Micromonospora sp. 050-3]|uniref:hypothetical protein n=1 Tax=Micromonospora sp. 050-3 TaxID=2789265 RepID=UPI00397D9D9F
MQLSAAVLVAIARPGPPGHADELLLVRHATGPTGLWALVAGFTARAVDPQAEPVVDGRELTRAQWFGLDALPAQLPPAYSISRWLIDATVSAGRR